jgi:hypothetical protein
MCTAMERGCNAEAALDGVALKLLREHCTTSQDEQTYKKLIQCSRRWLAFVRAFTVGVLLIPPGRLGIKW